MMTTSLEKPRPDDVLGNLPEDQQNLILDWCEEYSFREVLRKIAAPPPEGLGVNTHYTSLRRFYLKTFPLRFLRDRNESMTAWKEVAGDIGNSEFSTFWLLTKEALEKNIFARLLKDDINNRDVLALLRVALRMEDQRIKWRAQAIESNRHHLDELEWRAKQTIRERNAALLAKIYAAQAAEADARQAEHAEAQTAWPPAIHPTNTETSETC